MDLEPELVLYGVQARPVAMVQRPEAELANMSETQPPADHRRDVVLGMCVPVGLGNSDRRGSGDGIQAGVPVPPVFVHGVVGDAESWTGRVGKVDLALLSSQVDRVAVDGKTDEVGDGGSGEEVSDSWARG